MNIIIFDARNLISRDLPYDGGDLIFVSEFESIQTEIDKNEKDQSCVILNASGFEQDIDEKLESLKTKNSSIHLALLLFKNQSSSDVKKFSKKYLRNILWRNVK